MAANGSTRSGACWASVRAVLPEGVAPVGVPPQPVAATARTSTETSAPASREGRAGRDGRGDREGCWGTAGVRTERTVLFVSGRP
ncbi:hypothetical protein GCM10018987_38550 [Streptomyces cremeus]